MFLTRAALRVNRDATRRTRRRVYTFFTIVGSTNMASVDNNAWLRRLVNPFNMLRG